MTLLPLHLPRRRLPRPGRWLLLLLLVWGGALAGEQVLGLLFSYPVERFDRYGCSRRVLSRRGELLRLVPTRRGERLIPVRFDRVSPHLVAALVAAEDRTFFDHKGVRSLSILRAAFTNLTRGRIVSGASTITMQVARILEPRRRSYTAKVIEAFRARQLERLLTKEEILELYLNLAPLGGTLRGFEAASHYWFGKPALALDPGEAATLAAMLPAPSRRSPARRPDLLRHHRNRVLRAMVREDALTPERAARLTARPLGAKPHPWPFLAPHACDLLLRRARGLVIRSGIDLPLQRRLERIVRSFPGAGVDGMGAVILTRGSGRIRALVGSRNWRTDPLNTCACRRCAGSTLKPFLYGLALELGIIGPDTLLHDRPTRFHHYAPENFDRTWSGRIRAGEALAASLNLPAVALLSRVGVRSYRNLLEQLGIATGWEPLHLDLALGTLAVSPLALARAWRRFGDPGLDLAVAPARRLQTMAALSRLSPAPDLLPPGRAVWKTGTSSNRRDAWAAGLAGDYALAVWLGNLDGRPAPGLVGGRHAARLFALIVTDLPRSEP